MIRYDNTRWLTHFVHPTHSPSDLSIGEIRSIIKGKSRSFEVLKKILQDGMLLCNWSLRKGKRTIYGPKPAVCFTEMPLAALYAYVNTRSSYASGYGIALLKEELFEAGARPVIYGLTSKVEEARYPDPFYQKGFRNLSSNNNLGLNEQYRYVATSFKTKKIDWTHEREWRWVDNFMWLEEENIQGLPFCISHAPKECQFSKIVILVKKPSEKKELLDIIGTLSTQNGVAIGETNHSQKKLGRIKILVSKEWQKAAKKNQYVKLEDLEDQGFL